VLYTPEGHALIRLDCRGNRPAPVSLIAETSGNYRLEVQSPEEEQVVVRYTLTVSEVRPATVKDTHRVAAERSLAEGDLLLNDWKAESSRRAIDNFKDSLFSWRAAEDRREEANTLRHIGDIYQPLGEFQKALDYYEQALSLSRKVKNRYTEGETLNAISYVYITLGDNRKALGLCGQALGLSRAVGDRRAEAQALNNFGEAYYGLGMLQRSLEFYQLALPLWQELNDRQGQALTLLNIGYSNSDLGKVHEAFDYYYRAYALWKSESDIRGEAITRAAIGRLYSRMGENQEALEEFDHAIGPIQQIGDPVWEAAILTGMAAIYNDLGESRKALEYYNRAILLFRSAKHIYGEANALGDAGRVYFSLGDAQNALECHQRALSIFRTVGDRRMEIFELREIGRVYDSRGSVMKALESYLTARAFYRSEKDLRGEADTLNLIGRIYEGGGRIREAADCYERALSLSQKAEYRYGEAATLYSLARVERGSNHLTKARARIEDALGVIESLRSKVINQDLRASYFASVRQMYEMYIELLMELHKQHPKDGYDVAAFEASERARARSLLETLAATRVGMRQKANQDLLGRQRYLLNELSEKVKRRMLLHGNGEADAEEAALTKQIDEITSQYREVNSQLKAAAAEYVGVSQPEPLDLKSIQDRVVDDDTLLLEYFLGEESSYLWAVTKGKIQAYELPGRERIEDAANRVRNYLIKPQPILGESAAERESRIKESEGYYWQEAPSFARMLLNPAAEHLRTKRLLIVADGALQYIPFNALPVQGSSGELIPLMLEHEITLEPSASALASLRDETSRRQLASKTVAIFADPVFERDDSRLKPALEDPIPADQKLTGRLELSQALRDVSITQTGEDIPRLIASRDEADAIMTVAPDRGNLKAIGFEADKATATSPDLRQYRIIHFATHGVLDSEHPELSGLLLSQFDKYGRPQDGYLRLDDIYNLDLPADLVVLSACNTGLGKYVKGEGLVGLVRGFMYAGTARVVASLWKVDDEATAELMKHFYEGMFKRGLSPSAALRQAQLAMWKQKRWHAPYYWAAFVIQGQYRANDGNGRYIPGSLKAAGVEAGIAALAFCAFGMLLWRRRHRL
jgi:CHAT domain-containing protein/Tfp pilus assembly protein PilF